ncbi:MAG: hypothetical protein NTY19_12870 [Planctomycetota bacterium]|nr:hypothetical protein [Planctomycetota bacterium]
MYDTKSGSSRKPPIAGRHRIHVVASLRDAKPGLGEIEENAAQLAGVMLRGKEVPTFCHELLKTLHEALD